MGRVCQAAHLPSVAANGDLTGITIGSRKGNVCLTLYDKVTESQRDGDAAFWRSVWGVGDEDAIAVTRFEWSFKPYQANFPQMAYLAEYSFEGFLGLLNYASQKWGAVVRAGSGPESCLAVGIVAAVGRTAQLHRGMERGP